MNIQETIQDIIDKVRYLVRENETARKIAEAKGGIKVSLETNDDGEFEIEYMKFIGNVGELCVYRSGVLCVTDSDLYGTLLFEYKDFNELLQLQN